MAKKAQQKYEPVVTTELEIVDAKGKLRMHLSTWPATGLPRLALYDNQLLERVIVGLNNDGAPHISLLRPDGTTAIGIGVDPAGTGVLSVFREDGACVISITLDENQQGTVVKHSPRS